MGTGQWAPRRTPPSAGLGQVFLPASRQGALYPAIAGGLALLLAVALLVRTLTLGISFAAFTMLLAALVLFVAGGLAAYWAWACLGLRYELERGVLTIHWGFLRHRVPVVLLERAVRGRATAGPTIRGLDWPGCHVGVATVPRLGEVRCFSLHRSAAELLYLAGPSTAYAISVANPAGFIRALQDQQAYQAPIATPQVETQPALRALAWRDPPVQSALAAAAVLALLATAVIFSRYAGFPDQITLNFPEKQRTGARAALLGIPLTAWLLLLVNGAAGIRLSAPHRTAAFTLLYGLTFVEALLLVAAVTAV